MSIDIIGTLVNINATDPQNIMITPLEGYHLNITPDELTPQLQPFVVTPTHLRRVWAGDDPINPQFTVCLKFADEAEMLRIISQS